MKTDIAKETPLDILEAVYAIMRQEKARIRDPFSQCGDVSKALENTGIFDLLKVMYAGPCSLEFIERYEREQCQVLPDLSRQNLGHYVAYNSDYGMLVDLTMHQFSPRNPCVFVAPITDARIAFDKSEIDDATLLIPAYIHRKNSLDGRTRICLDRIGAQRPYTIQDLA